MGLVEIYQTLKGGVHEELCCCGYWHRWSPDPGASGDSVRPGQVVTWGCCHTPTTWKGEALRNKRDAAAVALLIMFVVVAICWGVFNWKFTLGGG